MNHPMWICHENSYWLLYFDGGYLFLLKSSREKEMSEAIRYYTNRCHPQMMDFVDTSTVAIKNILKVTSCV
jgi:hypothetical protein